MTLPYLDLPARAGRTAPPPPSAAALLEQLRDLGVRLAVDGPLLRASGNTSAITPELRDRIGEAKPALLALLVVGPRYACVRCDRHAYPEPGVRCWWCRRRGEGPLGAASQAELSTSPSTLDDDCTTPHPRREALTDA